MAAVSTINNTDLRAKYNPEGSILRQIQLRELSILVEFDRVCRKHGIDYWLDSGNLIGAVRHGGFIPWDDDIDVCVLKKDRNKLRKAMQDSLNPNYNYSEAGLESKYEYPGLKKKAKQIISRVYDNNASVKRPLKGSSIIVDDNLWLDILFMECGTLATKKFIEKTYGKCLRRVWNTIYDGKIKHILSIIAYPFSVIIKDIISGWCNIFHRNTYVHNYGTTFYSIRNKSDIFPLGEIEFEGLKFKAPHDVDSYLKRIYGNYMEIPPEDKIETHQISDFKVRNI